jgi:hypothetical protein
LSSCAQTAQANTTNLENRPIQCRKPGSTQKEEYHTAWRQKERQSLAYICTSTFRVFENELTTLRHGNQAKNPHLTQHLDHPGILIIGYQGNRIPATMPPVVKYISCCEPRLNCLNCLNRKSHSLQKHLWHPEMNVSIVSTTAHHVSPQQLTDLD